MTNSYFSNRAIVQLIRDIEQTYPVETWMINQIPIWPIIRNGLPGHFIKMNNKLRDIDKNREEGRVATLRNKALSLVANIFRSLKLLVKILFLKPCHFLFISDGVSYLKLNDKWLDRFCDPMVEELKEAGQTALLLEQLRCIKAPVLNKYHEIESLSTICYYLARFLAVTCRRDYQLEQYDAFLAAFRNQGLDTAFSLREMLIATIRIRLLSLFFDFAIKNLAIKQAFIVCYYGNIGYALALSGRNQKIEVTDIEHGSIINCPAYCDWTKAPQTGYSIVPSSFSFWHPLLGSVFERSNSPDFKKFHKFFVGGLRIIDYIQKAKANGISQHLLTFKKKFKYVVLVTLQPQFYGHSDWDKLAKAIRLLPSNWGWIIRSHPAYTNQEGMEAMLGLKLPRVLYDDGQTNIYDTLSCVDCHVTTASASCLEAVIFKIPTLFISKVGLEDFSLLINNQLAHYARNIPTIIDKLHLILDKKTKQCQLS